LEAARGNRLEALYVLAITAGLRIGELLGLKWEDIDLGAKTLRVRRTKSQAKTGPTFTAPKNGKGRSVRLTRRAVEALKSHKATQNAERLELDDLWQDKDLVFCTHGGKPLDFHNLRVTSFKPLLRKSGLPAIRFHDLRHTATLPRPPPQVGARAAGPHIGGDDAGPLFARPAGETTMLPPWRPRCPKNGLSCSLVYSLV
jgi:integrase